jgi:hypothetical protein
VLDIAAKAVQLGQLLSRDGGLRRPADDFPPSDGETILSLT